MNRVYDRNGFMTIALRMRSFPNVMLANRITFYLYDYLIFKFVECHLVFKVIKRVKLVYI